MQAQLTVLYHDRPARRFVLDPGRDHCLGRDPACDIFLEDSRISRRHAQFEYRDGAWQCRDLGSKNGVRLSSGASSSLRDAEWLDIGGLLVSFTTLSEERAAAIEADRTQRRVGASKAAGRLAHVPRLEALLNEVLEAVLELAGTRRAFLMLDNGHGEFEIVASCGVEWSECTGVFSGSLAVLRSVLSRRESVVTCDVGADADFAGRPSVARGCIRALACLPLHAGAGCHGAIYTDSDEPGKVFDELDLELLEQFAERASISLAAALLRESLDNLAHRLPRQTSGPFTLSKAMAVAAGEEA